MNGYLLTALAFMGGVAVIVAGELVNDEVRGWLDMLPQAVLRLAATRLTPLHQVIVYEDIWLPDLAYILKGKESRPITRLFTGMRFSLSLLATAPRTSGRLAEQYQGPQVVGVKPKDPLIVAVLGKAASQLGDPELPPRSAWGIRRRTRFVYYPLPDDRDLAVSMDRFRVLRRESLIILLDAGHEQFIPMTYAEFEETARLVEHTAGVESGE